MVRKGWIIEEMLMGSFLVWRKLKMKQQVVMGRKGLEVGKYAFMCSIISLMESFSNVWSWCNCLMMIQEGNQLMEGFSCFGLTLILCSLCYGLILIVIVLLVLCLINSYLQLYLVIIELLVNPLLYVSLVLIMLFFCIILVLLIYILQEVKYLVFLLIIHRFETFLFRCFVISF